MNRKAKFDKLLEPFRIGKVHIKNRMIKTGAGMGYANKDDYYGGTRSLSFYETLARGGVGLIIVESAGIEYPAGLAGPRQLHIDEDECITGFSNLTNIIHEHDCPALLSLVHAGPYHASFTDIQPVAASSRTEKEMPPGPWFKMPPRELTVTEIEEIINKFVNAAERAQKAGFDGVEYNAGTRFLLNSFLSRFWNKRQDAYGNANLESRARILVEIIRETKNRLGQDFLIGILMNAAEYGIDQGITLEEAQGLAQLFEKAGADAIQVRAYGYGDYFNGHIPDVFFYPEPPEPLEELLDGSHNGAAAFIPLAAGIKKVVSIPIISVGRLDPLLGEEALQQGKADFIGMTRRLLADPDLPNKVASGRLEDIAPCGGCIECFRNSRFATDTGVRCRVNAAIGNETEYEIKPAEKKKKVLIVGAGPAGMEAARVAALRGHEVIIYEKESKLGGLLPIAAIVKGTEIEDCPALVRYLETQITKQGVKIRLGKEANLSLIEEIKPDVVILATGGIPSLPEIPGINKGNVVRADDLHRRLKLALRFLGPETIRWLTRFWMPLGKRVIVIGGSIHGCELAEFLIKRGRKVTIVDTAETLGDEMVETTKYYLFRWLAKKGATMLTEVKYEEITDKGLTITTKEGKQQTIEADTIVSTMPLTANSKLLEGLEGKVPEIYLIGDCREPHLILEAIADGSRVARVI